MSDDKKLNNETSDEVALIKKKLQKTVEEWERRVEGIAKTVEMFRKWNEQDEELSKQARAFLQQAESGEIKQDTGNKKLSQQEKIEKMKKFLEKQKNFKKELKEGVEPMWKKLLEERKTFLPLWEKFQPLLANDHLGVSIAEFEKFKQQLANYTKEHANLFSEVFKLMLMLDELDKIHLEIFDQ